jgi:hypothetical protein
MKKPSKEVQHFYKHQTNEGLFKTKSGQWNVGSTGNTFFKVILDRTAEYILWVNNLLQVTVLRATLHFLLSPCNYVCQCQMVHCYTSSLSIYFSSNGTYPSTLTHENLCMWQKLWLNKLFLGHLMMLFQLQGLHNTEHENKMFMNVKYIWSWKDADMPLTEDNDLELKKKYWGEKKKLHSLEPATWKNFDMGTSEQKLEMLMLYQPLCP